ncbi:MAG: excinuclease ABC subunit UvrC [Clostridiales bacterium]|nr:excinuclease ABC subunit UvrC [Clostridiales bacterium]
MRLPLEPGVYIMKDKNGKIIYIGKAKALKNRVSQYFGSQNNHTIKVRKMVENVENFDYIIVSSEFEALVLECSLIKQHTPKYNILLKDDKGYHYIKISGESWKNLSAVKQKIDDGAKYLGPYTSSDCVSKSVSEACKIFKIPTCGKVFPRDINKKTRPCLNFYIKQCSAPCAGKIAADEHNKAVDNAVKFITGGSDFMIKELKKQMEAASDRLEFEKAAVLRDTVNAIEKTSKKQNVVSQKTKEQDVFAVSEAMGKVCMSVLRFSEGRLYDSEYFFSDAIEEIPDVREKMIADYYSMRDNIPPNIAVDGEIEGAEALTRMLSEKRGKSVRIYIPEKGENASLIKLCRSNSAEKLAQKIGRTGRDVAALDELGTLLGLSDPPEYIESYDISHTDGADNVAGMIVFKGGRPLKSAYRRFEIKGFSGQDDYRSLAEVLTRRFNEYEKHKDEGNAEGFGKKPDLILLDGGTGQVNAVKPVLDSFGLSDIPLFGMVKDGKHRTRAIATGGGEIAINDRRKAFTLVSDIQEEVHRFSIEYHRKKQAKTMTAMTLTEIDGIGKEKAKALLTHFKSVSAVKKASVEELKQVRGISGGLALNIYNYYHGENDFGANKNDKSNNI